ncbi:MAG: GWxTD domain-containing protein [Balneolaceae bacterium]
MKRANFHLHFLLLALGSLLGSELVQAQPQTPYQQGLELLYQGQTEQALDTWENYYADSQRIDSRAGFYFIEVVTEQNISDRYESATQMYYKALSNGVGVNSRIAIRQEIERLKPIIGEGILRQWLEWWDEENRELLSDMSGYWVQLDPTPATEVNERLIEHWQRIASAREQFTRNSSTIYGTDDRALIYIRYGEPDRIHRGILTLQDLNVKPWLQRQVIPREPNREEQIFEQETMVVSQAEILENAIYDFHRYPEYEVWFYDNLMEGINQSVPFIFGTNVDSQEFELQPSIDSFIPQRAFNPEVDRDEEIAEFARYGITPALMLQMLYYEQLVMVDPFFENRLNSMRDALLEQGREALQGLDLSMKSESVDIINSRTNQASRQISSFQRQIPEVPVGVYQYRFLDEDREPYLITFLESDPKEAFLIDFNKNRPSDITLEDIEDADKTEDLLPNYNLSHSLQFYDKEWNITQQFDEVTPIRLHRNTTRNVSYTVYEFPHTERNNLSASVQLMNVDEESEPIYDTPYPNELRGLGSSHFRLPEPLKSNPDSLQFADLVLGYQMLEESDTPFNFIVANNQVIPWQETLALHFEVYNLEMQENGFSQFELTYRILPVDDQGEVDTEMTEFVLTLNFTSEEERLIEDLEIETADLQPGLYELRVNVMDVNTRQEKNRSTRFEVIN